MFFFWLRLFLPLAADFEAGKEAYKKGDFATALKEIRPLAEKGETRAQLALGIMFVKGQGVAVNLVSAGKKVD